MSAHDFTRSPRNLEEAVVVELRELRLEIRRMREELDVGLRYISSFAQYAEAVQPGIIQAHRFTKKLQEL